MNRLLARDEREAAVDRAADRLAYLVLAFGVLLVVAVRSFVDHEAAFELLGLVVASGIVGGVYRARQQTITLRWAAAIAITIGSALVVAVALALTTR